MEKTYDKSGISDQQGKGWLFDKLYFAIVAS